MDLIKVSFTVTTDNLKREKLIMGNVLDLLVYEGIPEIDNIKIKNTNSSTFITDNKKRVEQTTISRMSEFPEVDYIKSINTNPSTDKEYKLSIGKELETSEDNKISTNNVSFTITTDNKKKRDLIMNKVLELLLDKVIPEIDNINIKKIKVDIDSEST